MKSINLIAHLTVSGQFKKIENLVVIAKFSL